MTGLTDLTLAAARAGLAAGDFTSEELTRAHLDALEATRPLNAFIVETPERALDMARASDARRAQGEAGLLEGLPIAVKDLFCTEGVQTTAGSRILGGFTPPYESTVTANLWAEGGGHAGQDQHGRIRHGLVQHHLPIRPRRESVARRRVQPGAGAGRLLRRVGSGGGGRARRRRRPAPIPAARSASRRPSAASSA